MKWYQIWYKEAGTNPIMPCAVLAKSEKEKSELVDKCRENGFEVLSICEVSGRE